MTGSISQVITRNKEHFTQFQAISSEPGHFYLLHCTDHFNVYIDKHCLQSDIYRQYI